MKKMTLGMAAVLFLSACGTAGNNAEEDATTGTATESGAEQQMTTDAANGEDSQEAQTESGDTANDDGEVSEQSAAESIREFELDLEFTNDRDWEYDYESDGEASIERDGEGDLSGQEAQDEFMKLFQAVQFSSGRALEDIKREVLEAVGAEPSEVRDFELNVKFDSGEEIEFDHDARNGNGNGEVDEFSLDLEFTDGQDASYEYESDDREAEIERRDGSESEGPQALEEMEQLLGQITVSVERSIDDIKAEVLDALAIDPAEVDDFDLEISYRGGEEIKITHDLNSR